MILLISDKRVGGGGGGKGGEYHMRGRRFVSAWKDTGGGSNFMHDLPQAMLWLAKGPLDERRRESDAVPPPTNLLY